MGKKVPSKQYKIGFLSPKIHGKKWGLDKKEKKIYYVTSIFDPALKTMSFFDRNMIRYCVMHYFVRNLTLLHVQAFYNYFVARPEVTAMLVFMIGG